MAIYGFTTDIQLSYAEKQDIAHKCETQATRDEILRQVLTQIRNIENRGR